MGCRNPTRTRGETINITNHTTQVLADLIENLPIGTNLGLYQFLWMLISGNLLANRGAIFPALSSMGLKEEQVRRSWASMRYGSWEINHLLQEWSSYVEKEGEWKAIRYAGYAVKSVDLSAYWRPKLKNIKSKHYDSQAGKALAAVVFGLIGQVGKVGEQRIALLTDLLRADLDNPSEAELVDKLIKQVIKTLKKDEIATLDAGFKLKALLEAGLERFVLRLPKNFTARRNYLPDSSGGRPPERGELVRPLERTYAGNVIENTPPDRVETWKEDGVEIRAEYWDDIVLPELKVSEENQLFLVVAIHDPRFENPLLLACLLKLSGSDLVNIYRHRWPIEQPPLASKQMIGAHRQFVFAEESCFRFPELTLLAGSILTYLAATFPPIATGFWDRKPKRTPGRLRRYLGNIPFSNLPKPKSGRIRKKSSVSGHLSKGIQGHRRSKSPLPA